MRGVFESDFHGLLRGGAGNGGLSSEIVRWPADAHIDDHRVDASVAAQYIDRRPAGTKISNHLASHFGWIRADAFFNHSAIITYRCFPPVHPNAMVK